MSKVAVNLKHNTLVLSTTKTNQIINYIIRWQCIQEILK